MSRKVVITGYGVICAIGNNAEECFDALSNAKHGVEKLKNIPSKYNGEILVGEVKLNNDQLTTLADLKHIQSNSRGALLGIVAVKESLQMAQLSPTEIEHTALISGTSVGGMDLFEKGYPDVLENNIQNPQFFYEEHDCGNINSKIASEIGLKSYLSTISTACSSSANAILLGSRLIKAGLIDRAIVGGSDALSKFTINGFNTLGILDTEHTSPFDENRKGLNLGEGAAYLVLEAEELCKDKKSYGVVAGYGNANDAFHQTASSDDGTGSKLSIRKALELADLQPTDIDYINTHGTGTPNNDFSESKAMQEIFGSNGIPPFNSLKPFTGHTLAACGSIEAIFSLYTMNNSILFPSLNFKTPIADTQLTPVTTITRNHKVSAVLSNSFGVGGNCTSLIFTDK